MGLADYRRKRDFSRTPEPEGARAPKPGHRFVVHKHDASRLHYDFRLEHDGVLKSWAVPKGPSLDPKDKRLAVPTEDHPLEYVDFEGVIPEGEYGGGTVLVWDQGEWVPEEDPNEGLRAGRLGFELRGNKLRGRWALVRTRGMGRDNRPGWLLIKRTDAYARPGGGRIVDEAPDSVKTGRNLEDIAQDRDDVWSSEAPPASSARPVRVAGIAGVRRARLPDFVAPELTTLVEQPPRGDDWLHEMKFDGYRILCRKEGEDVTLRSRNGGDWTERFPTVARAARRLDAREALLDGEVAMLLPNGTTSFQALQNALGEGDQDRIVYLVFDLLYLDGYDLRGASLDDRKRTLEQLVNPGARGRRGTLLFSGHVVGHGEEFFEQACRRGLEGVVSKRRHAAYRSARARDWLKTKCTHRQELVIGGYTEPSGAGRTGLGALLLGIPDGHGQLVYAGKVGTGFTQATLRDLRHRFAKLERATSPFRHRIPGAARAHWLEPELVGEVAFTEWTHDGKLRHPSFQGLREDKPAAEVVRERSAPRVSQPEDGGDETDTVAGVRLTHPDRVLYPEQGITKRELARYYERVAAWILPHLVGRPTTLVRCPEGRHKQCFYQKHAGRWAPRELKRVSIREKNKSGDYLVVDSLAGVIELVQLGTLEIHTWNATVDHIEQPDRLVFDLDPGPAVPWRAVIEAAKRVREELQAHGLESFVKTTGGRGLHVVAPIEVGPGWDACHAFARSLAMALAERHPNEIVASMSKARRAGRIFIDYLRNVRGATSVAAYSPRAKPEAPVSVPLEWTELSARLRPESMTIATVPRRLAHRRADPWVRYWRLQQKLPAGPHRRH